TDVTATSSGRFGGAVFARASAALDRRTSTSWQSVATGEPWIEVHFPSQRVDRLRLEPVLDKGHTPIAGVRLDFSDGTSREEQVPGGGPVTLTFPSRVVDSVRVTVDRLGTFAPPKD